MKKFNNLPFSNNFIFRSPHESDLNNLLNLQTEYDSMRYYGGTCTIEQIKNRLKLAIDHNEQFGYGLWSIFEKSNECFVGIAGVIHYNFNFEAKDLEVVICTNNIYRGSLANWQIIKALILWYNNYSGLLLPIQIRIEHENSRMIRLIEFMNNCQEKLNIILNKTDETEKYVMYTIVNRATGKLTTASFKPE